MSLDSWDREKVAIAGYHQSPIERHADRPLGAIAVDSARAAIADAGLSVDDIDGIVASSLFPSAGDHTVVDGVAMVTPTWLAANLGGQPGFVSGFQGMGQIPGSVAVAANAVASGTAQVVLWQRALHNPPRRYHGSGSTSFGGAMQWTAPQGLFGPLPTIGLATNEYFQRYGAERTALAAVSVEARKNGARIPWSAWYERPVTIEEYLDTPLIADPICRLDCDLPVDGVASFVFTTSERARDLPHRPVHVRGFASSTPPRHRLPLHWPLDDMMDAGRALTERLRRHADIDPSTVDLPQLYDGFSPFVWFWMETLGLCETGSAHHVVANGGIDSDDPRALPVLSGGGALGNGRMHGVPQMLECYLQLAGRAGDRQRSDVTTAMASHSSPHMGGAVVYGV